MGLFHKDKQPRQGVSVETPVEVVAHKNATKKTIEKAREANKKLNEILDENGFTLNIFIATGGKVRKVSKNNGN